MSKPETVPITLHIDAEAAAALERREGANWQPLCASLINRLAFPIAAEKKWRKRPWHKTKIPPELPVPTKL